jgi:hypothetical protein
LLFFFLGWPWTVILLISSSQVTRFSGIDISAQQ